MEHKESISKIKHLPFTLIVYLVLTSVTIWSKYAGKPDIENIAKPLLMPTLIVFYWINKTKTTDSNSWYLILALFFSMLGDIFLMPLFDNFILGLLNFLIAHLFYIILFSNINTEGFINGLKNAKTINFVIFLSYLGLLYLLISNMYIKETETLLIVAVIIYASIISVMVFNGSSLYNNNNKIYTLLIFIGGLFFMLSDSLIAINKFVTEVNNSSFYIMSTYCLAQFLIVYGVMNSLRSGLKATDKHKVPEEKIAQSA